MTATCSDIARANNGKIGDVAKGIDSSLVWPPLNVRGVKEHFVYIQGITLLTKVLQIMEMRVYRLISIQTRLGKGIKYGDHRRRKPSPTRLGNSIRRCETEPMPGIRMGVHRGSQGHSFHAAGAGGDQYCTD